MEGDCQGGSVCRVRAFPIQVLDSSVMFGTNSSYEKIQTMQAHLIVK